MLNSLKLLVLFTISSCCHSNIIESSRQKYEQILSSTTTSSCWQTLLVMLQDHCSKDQLDQYQSIIAYQFTICHLSTMNDDLSNILCHSNDVESCVVNLHQHMNAFIAYTEFYPFVQSICHVLRQKSYQSDLMSRLMIFLNDSQETITKLISSVHLQRQLTDRMKHQQYIQETMLHNAIKLKELAGININKTQDILTNVIQAARHEYNLLKQICTLSQTIQTIIRVTCSYSFWFYALSMFTVYIITVPKRTNRARSILYFGMLIYIIVERYYQMASIVNVYQWRLICWSCCCLILIYCAYKYQNRREIHNEQLCRLNTSLIQTEATFHRVSRELKRARSKSRSRSRSIRRHVNVTVKHPEDNKENTLQNSLIDDEHDQSFVKHISYKRHYSLIVPRPGLISKKSKRILLNSSQNNSNT